MTIKSAEEFSNQTHLEAMRLEQSCDNILGCVLITVLPGGAIRTFVSFLPGGPLLLLAGLRLSETELIQRIGETRMDGEQT